MRSWFSVALIAFIGFSGTALAEPFGLRQESVFSADEKSETIVFLAENEEDREKIVASIREMFRADLAGNPELFSAFQQISAAKGRSPSAVDSSEEAARKSLDEIADGREIQHRILDEATRKTIRTNFGTWFDRNYRICFALTRTFITTSVTTWSLMASDHIPVQVALPTGLIMGSVSGGMMYWNKDVQTYLKKSFSKYIPNKFLAKANRKIAPFTRWMLLEDGFIATLQLTLSAFGFPPSDSIPKFIKENFIASLMTVGAQGIPDIVVTNETHTEINQVKARQEAKEIDDAQARSALTRVQRRADLITLGVSAASVSMTVANIVHVPHIWLAYVVMGTGGVVYGYRAKLGNLCRSLLKSI